MTHNLSSSSDGMQTQGKATPQASEVKLLAQIASLAGTAATVNRLPPWYRPVVVIPTSGFTSQYGRWRVDGVESAVGKVLADAGADAYFFPCRPIKRQEDPFNAVWQLVRRADAVLISGGLNEMPPGWFAHSSSPQTGSAEWWEDWWRWHLTQLAILLCVPFLGIDQGAGYLNTVLGGELYQDIATETKSFGPHTAGGALDASSWVFSALEILASESLIANSANGNSHIWGACMHRQAVKLLAPDLRLTARAMDNCPEVIERPDAFFGLGTWNHPEQSDMYETQQYPRNLFTMLGESALVYATSQASQLGDEMESLRETISSYLRSAETPQLLLRANEGREDLQRATSGIEGTSHTETSPQSTDAIHPV